MNDQPVDPVEALLAERLAARAEDMPIRDDGLAAIHRGVRRRHRKRVVTWATGALLLVLATVGATALGVRSDDSAPYVDTPETTVTADPNVPATIPASPLPALAPADGSGYDWEVATWSGPSAYMVMASQNGFTSGTLLLRVQSTPWTTASSETTVGQDGQRITIDRSQNNTVDLSWELKPGVTASVGVGDFPTSTEDPVQKGLDLISVLQPVDASRWRNAVTGYFDPSYVLIDDLSRTALAGTIPTRRDANGTTSISATVDLWAPGIGWGQLTLESGEGFGVAPKGEPVSVRGLQGTLIDYVATGDGRRIRTLQWVEDERTYRLTFGAPVSLDGAVDVANGLRLIRPDEVDDLLFPTWQPANMPEMQLLPQGEEVYGTVP